MTIYLLCVLGLRQYSLPIVEKKESKNETVEGVGRQNLGEQLKRTDGGVVDEEEKNKPKAVRDRECSLVDVELGAVVFG